MINYSFIIPYHNGNNYLKRLLDSIPLRDDIEVIIVDDNSDADKHAYTDRTDVHIIRIGKEESKGAGRARNYGIVSAKGKWLLFADCDDKYEVNFIEKLDKFIDSDSDIIYFGVFLMFNPKTKTYKKNTKYEYYLKKFVRNKNSMFWMKSVKHSLQVPWNFMIRREYVININAKFAETPTCNDAYFHHFTAMNTQKVDAIIDRIYYWIDNPGSLTKIMRTPEQIKATKEQGKLMLTMRIEAGAWNTIPGYFENIGKSIKDYGIIYSIKKYTRRAFNGIPWHIIYWHKLLDSVNWNK